MPVSEIVSVAVRNISPTKVIFSVPGSKGDTIEWGYHGDPDGNDLQEVPEVVWMSTRLRRAKNNGILVEDTPEAMEEAFRLQRRAAEGKAKTKQDEVDAAIHAGTPTSSIVISAEDFTKHVEATAAQRQGSDVLDRVTAGTSVNDPMAAINAVEL